MFNEGYHGWRGANPARRRFSLVQTASTLQAIQQVEIFPRLSCVWNQTLAEAYTLKFWALQRRPY